MSMKGCRHFQENASSQPKYPAYVEAKAALAAVASSLSENDAAEADRQPLLWLFAMPRRVSKMPCESFAVTLRCTDGNRNWVQRSRSFVRSSGAGCRLLEDLRLQLLPRDGLLEQQKTTRAVRDPGG
ncbi:unnamed protein product [Polarella glacialis]|uniref:Uncharacterized protein n=1 Tax=Polarella glacialis TaxID=89957 RepID=A0A813KSH2_POLGL|nr:unnamed protein product [Polarella glacialis]